jgi:hypothetical protein
MTRTAKKVARLVGQGRVWFGTRDDKVGWWKDTDSETSFLGRTLKDVEFESRQTKMF